MSSGFSLLDEAWGAQAMPLPPRSSSKRKKKHAARGGGLYDDPIFLGGVPPAVFPAPFHQEEEYRREPIPDLPVPSCPECPPQCPPCPACPPQEIVRYVDPPRPPANDNYDTFLFVFSGVLLLFVLEQFLQIGIHIGRAQARDHLLL
jgi:hypothetical protein